MMQQYMAIKDQHRDAILMFRLGDFYEMFFDDAITASRVLELTLTGRNCGLEERAPMCGVPHHAVDSYIARLVKAGYKVAICEQMEDPAECKGIVQRDIVRIFTPGTLDILDSSNSNDNIYIASLTITSDVNSIAVADISTGELVAADFQDNENCDILAAELAVYNPKEVIVDENSAEFIKSKLNDLQLNPFITALDSSFYKKNTCEAAILNQFDVTSLISLGLDERDEMISSVGSLIMYLIDTQKQNPNQLNKLLIKKIGNTMQLDRSTMRNLELLETIYDHDVHGSLLGVLNKTKTAMGARLLKQFIREPLKDTREINLRLDAVEELKNNPVIANNITNSLKHVYDFQRLTARVAGKKANARDLIALKTTLGQLPDICEQLSYLDSELIREIKAGIGSFDTLYTMIDRAICEDPPFTVSEGGIIKPGYSAELDELKNSISDAKAWIASLETSEKERTGIKTLKVGYNKVFGYYIDVSKGMIDKVPEDYIRKQTLVNNERYITPELKEKENMVFSAETKINKLELEEFRKIRESIEPSIGNLQQASSAVALLDVLISFARVATENGYVKPLVNDSDIIDIKKGRHPAVEEAIGAGMFVSNDTYINNSDNSMLIITGPNMSGKSTYMRQTAVIILMAQIGSFVPAQSAVIGVVDRVFTRIGASDNLSYGQSTFYIEMSELANILRNAGERSLIILDEIGRGTSTFDGLSIAWATVEYLSKENRHVRTMFATHYHELTELSEEYDNVQNLSVAVAEDGNNVVFLHNIIEGPASKSYGIHVAKIAGVPEEIRRNARNKLHELEASEIKSGPVNSQLSFFADSFSDINSEKNYDSLNDFICRISQLDVNTMTPLNAMNVLQDVIEEAKDLGKCND
ncbi:MAG: DNA mismatch repair protein MutS [Clostridiales bacterium]|nr:DNA mismatch repair protein MutS [Candidatus Crickella caballi]